MKKTFPCRDLRYALWLPVYLLGFFILEHIPARPYWATQLPIDGAIPFCSWFVIPYATWFLMLIGTGLAALFRDSGAFRRYMYFLGLNFLSGIVLWIFFPNGQDLRPVQPDGALAPLVAFLYQIDTNTNVFPSLHVSGAIGAAIAAWDVFRAANRRLCWFATLLAVLITASTLFIKQHSVLDVIGAFAFSAVSAWIVYRPFPMAPPSGR